MIKKIFFIALTVFIFSGMFCLEVLFLGQQGSAMGTKDIGEEKDVAQCDPSSVTTYEYLMTFQTCSGDECDDPRNHSIYLAGSDDGLSWSMIEEFEPLPGSVPDLVFYNNSLYIFHTKGSSTFHWQKLNPCFEVADMGSTQIVGSDSSGGFVDPSMIVSGNDLIMFYLPGNPGGNPAGCDEYPCTREIHTAIADNGDVRSFTQDEGSRVSMYIEDEEAEIQLFCDPDILRLQDGSLLLYVSIGGSTLVYQGTSLTGAFVSPDDPNLVVASNVGGVPGSIQAPDGSVWLFVNKNSMEGTQIVRGVGSDGVTPIDDEDFVVVVDSTISDDFPEGTSTGSPSIIEWPEWLETTTSTVKPSTTTTVLITTTTTTKGICASEKIYGEQSEKAELLRCFRDNVLSQTPEGQEIIRLYYQWSPAMVEAMGSDEEFKKDIKEMIDGVLLLIRDRVK